MFGGNMAIKFVKGKKVCELQLDDKAKLIIYLDKRYNDYYFDSALYFFDGKKEHRLINDSFAFTIGENLYTRVHCINEYMGDDFANELFNSASQEFYEKTGKIFELSECINYDMYLYRKKGKVNFLLNKIKIDSSKEADNVHVIHKKIYETEVSEINLSNWRGVLDQEFIPRYVEELKKINKDISKEQIQESLLALKSGSL